MHDHVPELVSEHVMAGFDETSVAAFQHFLGILTSYERLIQHGCMLLTRRRRPFNFQYGLFPIWLAH